MRTAQRPRPPHATAGGPEPQIFRQLPSYEVNWRAMAASVTVHTVILALLICIPLVFFRQIETAQYTIVRLIAPGALPKLMLPRVDPKPRPRIIASLPMQMPNLEKPKPEPVREAPKPKPKPPEPLLAETKKEVEAPKPAPPKAEVKTGAFPTAVAATLKPRPAGEVQTGGFGVPYDAPKDGPRYPVSQLPAVGSFDLPAGPGQGNGTGGANGRPGVVMASGFGDARATGSGGSGGGNGGGVRSGGFGDYNGAVAAAPKAAARDDRPPTQPVEILSKPKPEYTQAARDLRLEGEVLLEVMFTARGEIRVLRMVRGLGHGLDEAAMKAAQQIRFKPAMRDGRPVDSSATVHIVFRLA